MKKTAIVIVIVVLLSTVAAAAMDIHHPARNAQPIDQVAVVSMTPVDNKALLKMATKQDEAPFQFAEPLWVDISPQTRGTWETLPDGRRLLRLVIVSDAAKSLNFGFSRFWMPKGGAMFVYSPDFAAVHGPYTQKDNESHGQLWTPMVIGERIVIEVNLPAGSESALELKLDQVSHGFRELGLSFNKSGSCNVDAVCPQGAPWADEIRSVALYTIEGTGLCTGAMIGTTLGDRTPYFLTACHCDISQENAATMVFYWNYQNSTCRTPGSPESGLAGDGNLTQTSSGAIFRAEYSNSDMALVELDDPVDPAFNVFFAGWDQTGADASSATAIHHPNGEEKRISFEYDPTSATSNGGTFSPGDGTHIRLADWDLGTTEQGSSGSPLFDANHRIIGQLHGGDAACGNDLSDWYGRVHASWTGGGTDSTRLSNWLDPISSGATTIDGYGFEVLVNDPIVSDPGANDAADPGETIQLTIPLTSLDTGLTAVSTVLSAVTPGVILIQNSSDYPDLWPGSTENNAALFSLHIPDSHSCGDLVELRLQITYTDGIQKTEEALLYVETGTQALSSSQSASPGIAIPDGNSFGITSQITFSGTGETVNRNVNIDINITHTWIGDLIVTLTSPSSTRVTLHNRTGGDAENIVGNYPQNLTPFESLDAFVGEPLDGTWNLTVSDNAGYDTGVLNSWAVSNFSTSCEPVADSCDINGDGVIDLTDIILGLQVIAGENTATIFNPVADINNDDHIGISEVLCALRTVGMGLPAP